MHFLTRRLLISLGVSFLAGFLTFVSVALQSAQHSNDQVARCAELRAAGYQCVWEGSPQDLSK